jgi:hypothetical protein
MEQEGVLFLRMTAGNLTLRLFPNQAAGATELPAARLRGGRGIGSRACGGRPGGSRVGFRHRRTGSRPAHRGTNRFCQRRDGLPIMRVIYNSSHPLEPPIGATGMAPASARRFHPRLVPEAQLQLATDHTSPFLLPGRCFKPTGLGQTAETSANRVTRRGLGPHLGARE